MFLKVLLKVLMGIAGFHRSLVRFDLYFLCSFLETQQH